MARGDAWALETLRRHEPAAARSQLPIVWDHASGSTIFGSDGRSWLDWTSGILAANAGHAPDAVVEAICAQAQRGLLHAYAFPTHVRARFVHALAELTGFPQVILVTTGGEAAEVALKIARSHALSRKRERALVVTFDGAFHGRTMGAQLAGGLPRQQRWTGSGDDIFVRIAFPPRGEPWTPAAIDKALAEVAARPCDVACVIAEVYQGKTLQILDKHSARMLREWCTEHEVLLVIDEVQSGFGRTGALFGYEHLGIRPDVLLCGKGLSGSLPVSAVLLADGRYADSLPIGDLGTTHSANPVALAAAEANLRFFQDSDLVTHAERVGHVLTEGLAAWARTRPDHRRMVGGIGMVAGFTLLDDSGREDPAAARDLVRMCAEHGLLLCMPAGRVGALIKAMPPLTTTSDELREGLARFHAASDSLGR